jgi:thiamine-monophosphate kinase
MPSEFELIARHFSRPVPSAVLGVGDDCALLRPHAEMLLAVSKDLLIEGRHFLAGTDPVRLGHKSLAVNLSDLAAMGADPRWVMLGLALPEADETWVAGFARGFFALAERHGVELVGGDTTRGPLTISVTIMGEVPPALALRRDGARAGDDVWLSGATGEAALGLAHLQGRVRLPASLLQACLDRLETPEPRVTLGGRLRGLARSAIDVSDGLLADLGHILEASGVRAEIDLPLLPLMPALAQCEDAQLVRDCLLAGGDDYELVFTADPQHRPELADLATELGLALTRIGNVLPRGDGSKAAGGSAVLVRDAAGGVVPVSRGGFDHFG